MAACADVLAFSSRYAARSCRSSQKGHPSEQVPLLCLVELLLSCVGARVVVEREEGGKANVKGHVRLHLPRTATYNALLPWQHSDHLLPLAYHTHAAPLHRL